MPTVRCDCGGQYQYAEEDTGKRSLCPRCGTILLLFSDNIVPIPLAREAGPDGPALREYAPEYDDTPVTSTAAPVDAWEHRAADSPPLVAPPTPARGYLLSVLNALLFPTIPENLIALFVLWFFVGIVVPLFRPVWPLWVFASMLVGVWYSWYQFAVVESAVAGDDRLPALANAEIGPLEFVAPVFKWLVSWLVVLAPSTLYVLLVVYLGETVDSAAVQALFSGVSGLPLAFKAEPMLASLVVLGVLFWPIVLLCLVVEGVRAVWRVDLMAMTILFSLEAYLATLLAVGLSFLALPVGLEAVRVAAAGAAQGGVWGAGQSFFLNAALQLLNI